MSLNDKKLERLDQLLSAFDSGAVQPDELIKAINVVMDILDKKTLALADKIVENKALSSDDVKNLRQELKQTKSNLESVILSVQNDAETTVESVRTALLNEVKRVESLIPVLPPETDLTEVFEYIEECRGGLSKLSELIVGENIRNSLESLQGEDRLDKSAIRGLDDYEEISQLAREKGGSAKGWASSIAKITAGTGVTIDESDPRRPIISATGGSGSGDVSKVGTPVNNQIGVWTGDGTIEGDADLTFDTATNTLATVNGAFSGDVTVADEAYDATGWNGDLSVPTKNAVRDVLDPIKTKVDNITITQAVDLDSVETLATNAVPSSYLDTDVSLAANSDSKIATQKATKSYVDAVAQGLSVKEAVLLATDAALPTNTYSNGASGVGATLTGVATGVLTIDGSTVALNDRILVKDEVTQANNGIYVCTVAGAIGVAYVLTRSTNMDTSAEFPGAFCFVETGTANADAGFVCTTNPTVTVGTTAITFTQFSGAGQITAGNALTKTGNTLDVAVDGSTIEVSADALRVKDAGITLAKMANLAQDQFIVRTTASTGVPETATVTAAARTVLDDTTVGAMRTTLGVGTADSPEFTAINLGHASDTTLTRVSAGVVAIEGTNIVKAGAATSSGLTMATSRVLGRTTASTGAIEELSTVDSFVTAASDTTAGKVELATIAETNTGTDATRAVTPDGLAGSEFGKRTVGILVSGSASGDSALTTGDDKAAFAIDTTLNGMNLVAVKAYVTTVSSSGAPLFQVRRSRRSSATARTVVDMLSTGVSIDASEFESADAASAVSINTSNDDVQTGDILLIDCDTAGTGTKGAQILLTFQLP